jgi:amidase
MTRLTMASASAQAAAIAAGVITSRDLLEQYLDRVERFNPDINAVVVLDAERARARADAADASWCAGQLWGPLHGVPMTVKEAFDVRGLPSTWGFEAMRENLPAEDALAVQRLMAAGAVIFGKTNVPVALADWQTYNPIYGTTNNPWDLTRGPGGSSGGSAAALAAGLTGLEIGSDIGASIRNPAHYCGVYGHKPTFGIASPRGHALPGAAATPDTDMAVIGPLARSAYDLELAMDALIGLDAIDAVGLKVDLPGADRHSLGEFKVAIIYSDDEAPVDEAVQARLRDLAVFLRDAGADVREDLRPAIDSAESHRNYIALLRAATSTGASQDILDAIASGLPDTSDQSYPARMLRAIGMTHREWHFENEARHRMRRRWAEYFEDVDLLLCPAATTVAFEHNQEGERWERMVPVNGEPQPTTTPLFWAGYPGHVYLPATVAPVGLSDSGLPVGVQIVGPQYRDYRCIRFAQLLEDHYVRFQAPSAYDID